MIVSVLVILTVMVLLGFVYVLWRLLRGGSDPFLLFLAVALTVLAMVAAAGWSHPYVVSYNGTLVELREEAVVMSPLTAGLAAVLAALTVVIAVDYGGRLIFGRGG